MTELAESKDKLQMTLVNLGPSILGGAFTTAAATVFLLPCRIVLFVKLGTMLVAWFILAYLVFACVWDVLVREIVQLCGDVGCLIRSSSSIA